MTEKFIMEICALLGVEVPQISYDTSHFPTKTMLAQIDSAGTTIFLRKGKPSPDQFFAVAHELRHLWQLRTDAERFFSDYKPIDQCEDVAAYNRQEAEQDANAFGGLAMEIFFGLSPQFAGMPADVKAQIFARMDSEEMQEFFD